MNSTKSIRPAIGIEEIGFCLPSSFLPIETLAEARDIPSEKLTKGLGLEQIAFCSAEEDISTLISGAIQDLVQSSLMPGSNYQLWFNEIDRIYLGTESAIDGSKPTISYAVDKVSEKLGVDMERIDVIDMTFACIGGVDALQICRDYVELNPDKKCIVVAGDIAKYDRNSGGEYTQGAGAIAMLVSAQPKMITIHPQYGVSSVHDLDFYKPVRQFSKQQLVEDLINSLELNDTQQSRLNDLIQSSTNGQKTNAVEGEVQSIWEIPSDYIPILRKEPTYDGKYSNKCYEARIQSALNDFQAKTESSTLDEYGAWLFHLPFCYQGRRTAVRYWYEQIVKPSKQLHSALISEVGEWQGDDEKDFNIWLKNVSKSLAYQSFVSEKIAPSEKMSSKIGNMYTASIFMAMLSHIAYSDTAETSSEKLLFLAYGSGSKAKVFAGNVDADFNRNQLKIRLENQLKKRNQLAFPEYESLHAQV